MSAMTANTAPVSKLDMKKTLKQFYAPSAKAPELVTVPPLLTITVDGMGDPTTSQDFQQAVDALYTLSYSLKFMIKGSGHPDYTVMPLEALWWSDNMADFALDNRGAWRWTAFIVQPDFITHEQFEQARMQAAKKKGLPALSALRLDTFDEGLSAQIMHIGPYSEERANILRLHEFIGAQGLQPSGKHHEIYLSDPGRTTPEKMKTVLRQPARPQ
jgi:hypothetical protein